MAADRTKSGTPLAELPEQEGKVGPVLPGSRPLTVRLTPTVDKIRQLYTRFGLRPYRVFLVHILWSGQRIGEGAPHEISRKEILPTPRVVDMQSTTEVLRAFGLTEEGGLSVDQVSAKYTEDDLMGRTPDMTDLSLPRTGLANAEFFWEVVESRASDPPSTPRMYVPTAVPMLSRDGFQWKVQLTKRDFNRARDRSFNRRGA